MDFNQFVTNTGKILELAAGTVLVVFAAGLSWMILSRIANNRIDISKLISEKNGDASMSRFQLLIFTFVISLSLFMVVVGVNDGPKLPDNFPPALLTLLGISGSSYLVSKAIQAGAAKPGLAVVPATTPNVAAGTPVVLTASATNSPTGSAPPVVTWTLDAPSHGNLAAAGLQVTYTAPAVSPGAGTTVTIRAQAPGFEDGTATVTLA